MKNTEKVPEQGSNDPKSLPTMKRKTIYGINFSEFELYCIRMISDFLFLDRFNDCASFVRFEQCFGPLFSPKNKEFKLVEAFKEIVGPKRKYLTFRRMIKAYINWKLKKSNNYSFNFFMDEVFKKMIKKRGEVVGELVEGQRVFSTKNCRNRKIITKFSVLTDEQKNKIKGFVIEYDTVFKAILCKQEKKEDIHLEINFDLFHSKEEKLSREFQLDRDGISHIAGKYDETSGNIKFLIFKCRSGKTLYIGDPTETEQDKISPFIFGSSKCQLKTMVIELINDQLAYIQPKYQISTRKNDNLEIDFDSLDEKFLENDPPKFEEAELENSDEELKDDKKYLFPLIPDDQFVDKMSLVEPNHGKSFKEVYKSIFDKDEKTAIQKLKESIKKLIEDNIYKEQRDEKLRSEQKKIVFDDSYYKKNKFESVFVKMIRMTQKELALSKNSSKKSGETEEDEEEEDEEDELNLIKIKSGEYEVKEKKVPLRAKAEKFKEMIEVKKKESEKQLKKEEFEKEVKKEGTEKDAKKEGTEKDAKKKEEENKDEDKKEKEPLDNLSKSKSTVTKNTNNHKVVEINLTKSKSDQPKDSVKK